VSGVDSSKIIILTATWVLMLLWLAFVFVSGVVAFRKWQKTEGSAQVQMLYLWIGAAVVFTGDFLHTIAATISTYPDNATGPIHVLGGIFEFRTFAMFFDALVFMVYYTLWALFIVIRYQQGTFKSYDKISISLAAAAIVLILPGAVPNALGIYTLEYDVMTVYKLINCSRYAVTQTVERLMQQQERALSKTGIGFAFSFLFFFLSLALLPVNELFAMFMIPKTFAYMFAFYHLIKGVLLSTAEVPADVR
jgi:hypothetical protein